MVVIIQTYFTTHPHIDHLSKLVRLGKTILHLRAETLEGHHMSRVGLGHQPPSLYEVFLLHLYQISHMLHLDHPNTEMLEI